MLFTFEDDLRLCSLLKINPTQLMFMKALVRPPHTNVQDWKRSSYAKALRAGDMINVEKKELIKQISDLIAKEYVIDLHTGSTFQSFDYYEITEKVSDFFDIHYRGMPGQLHDAFPFTFSREGKEYHAKSCSEHDIAIEYLKSIDNNIETHKQVIDDVKWAIENNQISMGLLKFVNSKQWKAIRHTREKFGIIEKSPNSNIV